MGKRARCGCFYTFEILRCCLPATAPAQQEIEKRYPPNYGANNPWIIHIRRRSSHRHTHIHTHRQTDNRSTADLWWWASSITPNNDEPERRRLSRHSRLDYNNGRRGWLLPPMNDGSKTTRRTNLDGKWRKRRRRKKSSLYHGYHRTDAHLTKNWWSSSVFFPCSASLPPTVPILIQEKKLHSSVNNVGIFATVWGTTIGAETPCSQASQATKRAPFHEWY